MVDPVVVVGAGPTGLMLACELGQAGVEVVVLEKLPEPSGVSRSIGFHARTAELFDQRGLLDRLGPDLPRWRGNHFGLLPLNMDLLDGPQPHTVVVGQVKVEELLEKRATELGVDLRRGSELVGLSQDESGVDVRIHTDGRNSVIRSRYVVGCDGVHSAVRTLSGIDFPGTPATFHTIVADVAPSDTLQDVVRAGVQPGGMLSTVLLDPERVRVMVTEFDGPPPPGNVPVTDAEFHAAVRGVTQSDIDLGQPLWLSRLDDTTRLAEHYRSGRVFLAGDAAHTHYPMSGQAMDTGIHDAVNLGWKLAADVQCWAPPGLLDTYHDEREPIGQDLCFNTRAQMALLHPRERVSPLRELMARVLTFDGPNQYLLEMITGVGVRYPIDYPGHGMSPEARAVLGRRVPNATGALDSAIWQRGHGILLDRSGAADLTGWADRITVVIPTSGDEDIDEVFGKMQRILIRPDGHVVWADPDGTDEAGLQLAVTSWFGT